VTDIIKIPTENLGFSTFDHAELEETVRRRLRQRRTTGNENIEVLGANPDILAISWLHSVELVMVENPEFAVVISMLSVILPVSSAISGCGHYRASV